MLLNFEILANTSTLAQMFFASTIFITLAIARYATLAKLIRDSRADIEKKIINFNKIEKSTKSKK